MVVESKLLETIDSGLKWFQNGSNLLGCGVFDSLTTNKLICHCGLLATEDMTVVSDLACKSAFRTHAAANPQHPRQEGLPTFGTPNFANRPWYLTVCTGTHMIQEKRNYDIF
jgi:hypothetical protein